MTGRPRRRIQASFPAFPQRFALAVLAQVVGYAALLAAVPHSEPTALVGLLGRVPTPLLLPFALVAVPAVAVGLVLGAVLSLVGLSPTSLPALLLARGDVLVFAGALAVGAAAARLSEHDVGG